MGWYIHHVNLPSMDVPKTRAFLRDVIGFQTGDWVYPENQGELHHDDKSIAFFGSGNRGIHAVRPIPTFAVDNGFIHNPTIGGHFALTVPDLKPVMERFDDAGVLYSDAGIYAMAGIQQIYVYDPSMNVIEINQLHDQSGGAPPPGDDEQHGRWVEAGDWYIHHVNIPSHDVLAATAFFRDLVGIEPVPIKEGKDDWFARPENMVTFGNGRMGINIVRPTPGYGLDKGFLHNPTVGGHKAFGVTDIEPVKERLTAAGIPFTDVGREQRGGMYQIYVLDPSNNLIEIVQDD